MDKESKQFLVNLLNQSGPSGFEEETAKVWIDRTTKYADRVNKDVMGNSIACLNEGTSVKVMLAGHCDEIGFIVSHISDKGFIHIQPIGGIDRVTVSGAHVDILTEKGKIRGVIGKKAIHLEDYNEYGKAPKYPDILVDIGAKNKKDALKSVQIGDPVSYTPNFTELKNGIFSSKGCDDKVGAFVVSEVIKILSKKKDKLKVSVYAVATVQEEVGLRGATSGAYQVNPDVAFAVDVGWATVAPQGDVREIGTVNLGKGPVLHAGPVNNRKLLTLLKKVAKQKKIAYQLTSTGRPGGTDTSEIQLSRGGTATSLISIPNRYMHTQVETCAFKDLELTAKLIAETIVAIKPNTDFIPS
ncbi:MAG TPA: M42 family metallopeptidase [Thermodesulfobacteriota bacterium]|nr:M42 family metallopeptidase [Thermodesulfobacteriota bacterium]